MYIKVIKQAREFLLVPVLRLYCYMILYTPFFVQPAARYYCAVGKSASVRSCARVNRH